MKRKCDGTESAQRRGNGRVGSEQIATNPENALKAIIKNSYVYIHMSAKDITTLVTGCFFRHRPGNGAASRGTRARGFGTVRNPKTGSIEEATKANSALATIFPIMLLLT